MDNKHLNRFVISFVGLSWLFLFVLALVRPEPERFYSYHMSFHEKWYPEVMRGTVTDNWLPPGYIYSSEIFSLIFPEVVSLRIVSILSSIGLFLVVWMNRNLNTALLVLSSPILIVFGTRAQPDALMVFLMFIGMFLSYRMDTMKSGFIIGLSSFIKPVGLLAIMGTKPSSWKFLVGMLLGMVPSFTWVLWNQESILLHLQKSVPFENALRMLIITPFFIGTLFLLRTELKKYIHFTIFIVVVTMFAFAKAPLGHEYYLMPALLAVPLVMRIDSVLSPKLSFIIVGNALLGVLLNFTLGKFTW